MMAVRPCVDGRAGNHETRTMTAEQTKTGPIP